MKKYQLTDTAKLELTLDYLGFEFISADDHGRQIDNCQAWELEICVKDKETGHYRYIPALQSYNTAVAVLLDERHYVCGYWSKTTSAQVNKWLRGH